jgi:replicative DNA helicase
VSEQLRQPPHSIEAEQSLLGALLLDSGVIDRIGFLKPAHFYRQAHQEIFEAVLLLLERSRGADMLLVCQHLEEKGTLDRVGGAPYVAELMQASAGPANLVRYAEVIRDKAILRQLQTHAQEVFDQAWAPGAEPMVLAEQAGAAFLSIEVDQAPQEMVPFGAALVEAVDWVDNPVKGLSTGLPALDEILNAMVDGDLIIVAGRPSMGKTALAMNIAEHVAKTSPVALFSLEMTRKKIAARALKYHESMLGRDAAIDHLSACRLHIDDTAAVTLGHMRLRLRRMKRKDGLALVVVDYLQLMRVPKPENRTQEVSELSRGLKAIAKEFGVPVIAVAQLNRTAEGRADRRPILSDLRESGQIEQDADVIAFVYRDDYYNPDTQWRGIAEVIVRKNRDGPVGTAYLRFLPEYTRFRPMDGPLPDRDPAPAKGRVLSFDSFDNKSRAAGGD